MKYGLLPLYSKGIMMFYLLGYGCTSDGGQLDLPSELKLTHKDYDIIVSDVYKYCRQHTDCILVDTSCAGCCQTVAITQNLEKAYAQNFVHICSDYKGDVCDCTSKNIVSRCLDTTCVVKNRKNIDDCYSPTQNIEHAYDPGAVGCVCDKPLTHICVHDVALKCNDFYDGNYGWEAFEDGPCIQEDQTCKNGEIHDSTGECLKDFYYCYELDDGKFCGLG